MISIIVPTLNEAPQIRPFLLHLRTRVPSAEIIVVDGGSDDGTDAMAESLSDIMIRTKKGRGKQLNTGAKVASGDIYWFLHVDCEVPHQAASSIIRATFTNGYAGGCFRIRIPDARPIFRIHDSWAHWIGRAIRVRCGDHGIFCTREAFYAAGGYKDVPLMEDVEFVRGLHRVGAFAWLEERLVLSSRRHYQVGPYWYTLVCASVVGLYCLGVSHARLASLYHRMVSERTGTGVAKALPSVEPILFAEFRMEDVRRQNTPG